ncbi:unnamed protein product [Porites evermanni]|uniref:Uncharacterized protein n=1 Tax=Porites evermanni TaxID=104178 RepID=A0ABN8QI58_9CNID|nr:unnamed protein product [Porites evermanni]
MLKPAYQNTTSEAFWDIPIYAEHNEVRANRIDARLVSHERKEVCTIEMSSPWIESRAKKDEEKTLKYGPMVLGLKQRYNGYGAEQGTKDAVEDVYSEIDKRIDKSEEFVEEILCKFTNLENHIIDEVHGRPRRGSIYESTKVASVMSDSVLFHDVQNLCELDKTEETKTDKLLREIKDKIDQLETMMDEKFNEVSKALQKTRTKSLIHGKIQENLRKKVETRFHEHEKFIRTNLLKLL